MLKLHYLLETFLYDLDADDSSTIVDL